MKVDLKFFYIFYFHCSMNCFVLLESPQIFQSNFLSSSKDFSLFEKFMNILCEHHILQRKLIPFIKLLHLHRNSSITKQIKFHLAKKQ